MKLTFWKKKQPAESHCVKLHMVFGINPEINDYTYVDRGNFDATMKDALERSQHVAIHGASKQGKSWLRARALEGKPYVVVQCVPETTVESLFTEALGKLGVRAELRRTEGREFEGSIDFDANLLVFSVEAGAKGKRSVEVESTPLGRTAASVGWVAYAIRVSGKTLIIEDCHYLAVSVLVDLSFILKALYENGVYVVIVGVWTDDHRLTQYNGDLDGRVQDIHVKWSDGDLNRVLEKGCKALNIQMTTALRNAIIADASGNVGMVHRLAEEICKEERIEEAQLTPPFLTRGGSLDRARSVIASGMRGRFDSFASEFNHAIRNIGCPAEWEPNYLLRAIVELCTRDDLIEGVTCEDLFEKMRSLGGAPPDKAALDGILRMLGSAQVAMKTSPPVLTYNENGRKMYVTDRSFFFFVRYSAPHWPWSGA